MATRKTLENVLSAMRSWLRRLAVVSVVLGVAVGCSQPVPGTITTPSSPPDPSVSGPPTPGQTPSSGASPMSPPPEVTAPIARPLDLSRFTTAPCTALTPEQVTGFLGTETYVNAGLDNPYGPYCYWAKTVNSAAHMILNFNNFPDGVAKIYEAYGVVYKFALPVGQVLGYPTIAYGITDQRAEGICYLRIKTTDHETINIKVQLGEQFVGSKDPCVVAREVATTIIGNIQGAQ